MTPRIVLLTLPMLLLCSCQILLTAPTGTPETSTMPLDRRPIRTPSIEVTSSATKDRWTIHVSQRVERTVEVQTVTQQKARRYLFWPLAPLNGLTQCPIGLFASDFSSNESIANMRQVGCMRLLAMEPLRNTIARKAITDRDQTTQQSDSPLAGADVLFTPEDPNTARLRQVTLADGVATIQTESTSEQVGELLVRMNNRTLLKQRVAIAVEFARLRERRGLSQSELAKLTGMKQPQIARLESGAHLPALATLQKLLRVLGGKLEVTASACRLTLTRAKVASARR
jgi:DNA-binding XRE family transcriptional regulator